MVKRPYFFMQFERSYFQQHGIRDRNNINTSFGNVILMLKQKKFWNEEYAQILLAH